MIQFHRTKIAFGKNTCKQSLEKVIHLQSERTYEILKPGFAYSLKYLKKSMIEKVSPIITLKLKPSVNYDSINKPTISVEEVIEAVGDAIPGIEKRLTEACKPKKEVPWQRNCHGTALFLAGVHPKNKDILLGSTEAIETMAEMPVLTEPQIGNLLIIRCLSTFKGNLTHTGFVIKTNPPTIIHRFGRKNGQLRINPADEIIQHYENTYKKRQDPAFPGKAVIEYRKMLY